MSWYLEALKKYWVFRGRATRQEFWYFCLFNMFFSFVLLGITPSLERGPVRLASSLAVLCIITTIIPFVAVSIRRLHDTNRSGRWLFIAWIPLIGPILLLSFLVQDSDPNKNQYGSNPKIWS